MPRARRVADVEGATPQFGSRVMLERLSREPATSRWKQSGKALTLGELDQFGQRQNPCMAQQL